MQTAASSEAFALLLFIRPCCARCSRAESAIHQVAADFGLHLTTVDVLQPESAPLLVEHSILVIPTLVLTRGDETAGVFHDWIDGKPLDAGYLTSRIGSLLRGGSV
jgi:hypothetical protein